MSTQLDLVALFEGLSPEEAKDLAARIRSEVSPELETSRNPNRVQEKVERVHRKFTRELHSRSKQARPGSSFLERSMRP